jgi:hypothetical protein
VSDVNSKETELVTTNRRAGVNLKLNVALSSLHKSSHILFTNSLADLSGLKKVFLSTFR